MTKFLLTQFVAPAQLFGNWTRPAHWQQILLKIALANCKREILVPLPLLVSTSDIGLGVASACGLCNLRDARSLSKTSNQPASFTQSSLRVYLNLHSIPLPSLKVKHCVTCPSLRSKGSLPSFPPPLRLPASQTA